MHAHTEQPKRNNARLIFISLIVIASFVMPACGTSASSSDAAADLLANIPDVGDPDEADPPQLPNTFVGEVAGSNFYIAVVIEGNTAVGYLCDNVLGDWLKGSLDGDQITLTGASGSTVAATLADGSITGQVTPPGGAALNFTAVPTTEEIGLYRGVYDPGVTVGWIILEDGIRGSASGITTTIGETSTDATCSGLEARRDKADKQSKDENLSEASRARARRLVVKLTKQLFAAGCDTVIL